MRGYDDPFWHAGQGWRRDPGAVPPSQMRVSDAERQEIAEALSKHFADGRLDKVEFDERLGKAMTAKTRGDLSGLLADLPPVPGSGTAPPPPYRRGHGRGRVVLAALAVLVFLNALTSWTWHGPYWHGGFLFPHFGTLLVLGLIAFVFVRRVGWGGRTRSRVGRGPF